MSKQGQFWVIDTEDDSKGNVYWVNYFNGVEHHSFNSSDRALEWLMRSEGEFWACNLEYDLINLFGALLEPLTVLTYGGFGLLKASVYGKPIQFRNTLRHWPLTVEEMGNRLGYPKLPFDPTNLEYCKRDCEVTWLFINSMFLKYEELGIEHIKATLPSTSLQFFTEKWCKVNWFRHADLGIWKFLARSRYGGRTEIFQLGEQRGYIHEYDLNSSYPAAMTHEEFPNLDTLRQVGKKVDFNKSGVVSCLVKAPNIEFPLLPYKEPESGKLLFPIGTFGGTWTYVEMRKALDLGYQILDIYDAIEYDLQPSPFKEYMTFIYHNRKVVYVEDELMGYTLKILMNALFGKWGEEGELQVISRGKRYVMRQVPKHSNMIWASYVLAYGRLNLYDCMIQASKVGKLLYTDTDSIFVKTATSKKPFPGSNVLGELSFKKTHGLAHFKLPKLYRVESKYKAKGIPSDKKNPEFPDRLKKAFFEEEVAEFMKPYRWIEAKKLHEQANVWRLVSKQVNSEYNKRLVLKNGATWPLTIGENRVINPIGNPVKNSKRKPKGRKLEKLEE